MESVQQNFLLSDMSSLLEEELAARVSQEYQINLAFSFVLLIFS